MSQKYRVSAFKGILFSISVAVFFLVGFEFVLRIYLYSRTPDGDRLALYKLVEYGRKAMLKSKVTKASNSIFLEYNEVAQIAGMSNITDPGMIRGKLKDYLFMEPGVELLEHFKKQYRDDFFVLVQKSKEIKARLFILYFPMIRTHMECKDLYRELAKEHNLEFLDMTDVIKKYPVRYCHYAPENGHYSRFGYQIIAENLKSLVQENKDYRSDIIFDEYERPKKLGDKEPNTKSILEENGGTIVYRQYVNKQGFKMMYDLEFPKSKQRILCLGDSFTEGPLVPTHDSYVGFLQKLIPEIEFINAGVGSYSIEDQKELLVERACYSEPDLIFLQVLDNDLFDQFFFYRNFLSRSGKEHKVTDLEMKFFEKVKKYRQEHGTLTHINDL